MPNCRNALQAGILISRNFSDRGDYEKSLELNFQALKIFEDLTDKKGIAKTFYEIARVYFEQGNNDKAFSKLTTIDAFSSPIYLLSGEAYSRLNKTKRANIDLNQ